MKLKIYSLYLMHVLNDGFSSILLFFLPFIAHDFGMNLTQVGWLGTLFNSMEIFLVLPAGYLAYKFGNFRILTLGVLVFGLGFLLTGISPNFLILCFIFTFAGIGFAALPGVGLSALSKLLRPENRANIVGEYGAVGDLGRAGLMTLASFVIVYFGWRYSSLAFGSIILLIGIFLSIALAGNEKSDTNQKNAIHIRNFVKLLNNKLFVFATSAATIDALASSDLFIFLPFLFLAKNIDPKLIGAFTAIYFVGNVSGKVISGRLASRLGSARTFILSEVLMAGVIALIALATTAPLILLFSFVLGFITKSTFPAYQTMLMESERPEDPIEIIISACQQVRSIANTLAPLVVGFVASLVGIKNAFYFNAVVALIAIIPAIAFVRTQTTFSRLKLSS